MATAVFKPVSTAAFNRGNLVGPQPKTGCPFCRDAKLTNTKGYCPHLIGFTLDGYTMEIREQVPGPRSDENGKLIWDGEREKVSTPTAIEEGDIIATQSTPTSRVYRAGANAPYAEGEFPEPVKPRQKLMSASDVLKAQNDRLDAERLRLEAEKDELMKENARLKREALKAEKPDKPK